MTVTPHVLQMQLGAEDGGGVVLVEHDGHGLGFDASGRWEMGVAPLLIPAGKALVNLAVRVRQRRQAEGKAPVVRVLRDRLRRPAAPPQPLSAPPAPAPAGRVSPGSFSYSGGPMSHPTEDVVSGAQGNMRRGCRIRKRGGRAFAYDPSTGEEVEVLGYDDGDEQFGADDGDMDMYLGGEDEDDELFGAAEDEADELVEGADVDGEQEFGAKAERLDKRIAKLERRAEKLRDRIEDLRGPLKNIRRKKLNKRIKRLANRIQKLRNKKRKAEAKRKNAVARADRSLAAAGVAGAAGAAAGVAVGASLSSRTGSAEAAKMNDPNLNPLQRERLLHQQAQAGLSGSYRAPPGSGRLLPVPMTQDGTTNPRNAHTVPAGGLTTNTTLFAEDLSFAEVRLVGFQTSLYGSDSTAGAMALVEDFKISGSGNLFLHEGPGDAAMYQTTIDRLTALRHNPRVKSPNKAQVDIAAAGDNGDVMVISCVAVYDVIWDDTYGAGVPGAYA